MTIGHHYQIRKIWFDPTNKGFDNIHWVDNVKPYLFATLWSTEERKEIVVLSCLKFHKGTIIQAKNGEKQKPELDQKQIDVYKYLVYEYAGYEKDAKGNTHYRFKVITPKYPSAVNDDVNSSSNKRKRVTGA